MSTITCPSGLQVRIRGLKVKEEKILADRKLQKSGEQIEQILKSCCEGLVDAGPYDFDGSIDWKKLLNGDRFFMLLKIRQETYGNEYAFGVNCANDSCRERFEWEVDTSTLPVRAIPEGSTPAGKYTVTLPDSQVEVTFHLPTGETEALARRLLKGNETSPLTTMLLARCDAVAGIEPGDTKGKRAFFEDLSMGELAFLRDSFEERDCGVETGIEIECQHCGNIMEIDLPLERSFLLPNKKRKTGATSSRSSTSTSGGAGSSSSAGSSTADLDS